MSCFANKTLLITGGTGTLGNAVLQRFLRTDIGQIRVFSRDEKKQHDMRQSLCRQGPAMAERVDFYIGDVRDPASLTAAMAGVDYVFHAAALKQVPSCEFFPMEAVKTNVLGTENVLSAAVAAGVETVVCLSTDKAVYPVSAMGISKAMMEKVALAKARTSRTRICCTRLGNILGSRGSVIPLWLEQIREGKPLGITVPEMTRFVMTPEEAVALVLDAFENGAPGEILIPKAAACTVAALAQAVTELCAPGHERCTVGIRHSEKLYETLLTGEEAARALDMGWFYKVPSDNRSLNYTALCTGDGRLHTAAGEYASTTAQQLTVAQLKEKLLAAGCIPEV